MRVAVLSVNELAGAVDSRLRNAGAHEEFRVEDDGTVVLIDDGARLPLAELEQR